METPIETLASAVHSAIFKDLPDIEYMYQNYRDKRAGLPEKLHKRRPHKADIQVQMFPQTWGTTAMGFGGIGGSAMKTAYTIIVMTFDSAAVYFNGTFAYLANPSNVTFQTDLQNKNMRPVSGAARYLITNAENKPEQ